MDPETARLVVIGGTAAAAVAWIAGLATLLRASRERRAMTSAGTGRFEIEGEVPAAAIVGEADVEGDPEGLSIKLAGLLARDGSNAFGPVKIVARDRHELTFEAVGPSPLGFRRGWVRFAPAGPRTRLDYALETSSRASVLLGVGWAVLGLGLLALIGVTALMFTVVLPSPFADVRGQAAQVVQMVHLLWPPFLFAHLSRLPARMFRARMDSLIHNLPYS